MKRNPRSFTVQVHGNGSLPRSAIRHAVESVLAGQDAPLDIAVSFVSTHQMRRLNREFLRHDYSTDVLTFSLDSPGGARQGDMYICRGVAAANARAHGRPVLEELLRLAIHGTLHLLGHDHPSADRERSPMWQLQERHLHGLTRG